uniref:Ubiquitin carboxyl-terminal hydrolase n=1 Tax=Manihot esculenta TaxID=3983 RepID=A0A2C9UF01_MANES
MAHNVEAHTPDMHNKPGSFNLQGRTQPSFFIRIGPVRDQQALSSQKSEGGLFVDMNTFLAFGKDYVGWNYEKTGNSIYLNIKQIQKLVPEDRPSKKPTLLAIGVDGGFDNSEPEYEETHNIVLLPDYVTFPFPSVELPKKIRLAVDAILMAEGAEWREQLAAWTADKKQMSAYAMNLQQIDNGVTVPPSGWKCSKYDKQENLWLNLTDGMILCGRRNWDGSGENNHAIEHYKETGYPLAVKLGTITADLEAADVFSYPEDDSVLDPLLAQHLAFFGIDFSYYRSGKELEPIFGPGYTGLVNLGNSCHMATTMQVVFSTRSFSSRYYLNQNLKTAFEMAPADPTVDLNMQLTKLAHGMLSGKYLVPAQEKQEGIPPRLFKSVIAASHPEFFFNEATGLTCRNYGILCHGLKTLLMVVKKERVIFILDALEFFLHFLDQVERVNGGKPTMDPSRSFKFGIEERILCSSGKVAYNRRLDYILSLNIFHCMKLIIKELEAFQKLKAGEVSEGKDVSSGEIVRPRVPLEACLASFSAPEQIQEFYSTPLKAKTTAQKVFIGLTSFPDYLVLHMRKFVMEEGWVPKKLDVYVDVPDIIDITPEAKVESDKLLANEDIVSQLVSMGFNHLHCEKAAINTLNADIDVPISQEPKHVEVVDQSKIETLISFGFQEEITRKALKASGGDIEMATDWIFNNPDASVSSDMDATTSSIKAIQDDTGLPDGGGSYRLFGIVSHIGTSTQCGHYVAHILKDGRWVIFNDKKVGASVNPPKDMGYLYFFERLDS